MPKGHSGHSGPRDRDEPESPEPESPEPDWLPLEPLPLEPESALGACDAGAGLAGYVGYVVTGGVDVGYDGWLGAV